MPDTSISIRSVRKAFGSNVAVRDLDLDVPTGSLCGFLGPNGAGKSTTIRMIMSIIYPDSGTIEVLGGSALRSKDRIGYLPEERGVYRKMRVGEFLSYMARLKGLPGSDVHRRVRDWLQRIELPDVERKRCEELSKGMQQKVQFIAAVIHEPELLIFDEPFSGLDPVNTELLRDLIQELHRSGTTIIFSTHILHQAEQLCDRIFLINRGEKLLDSSLQEIRERYDPRTILVQPLGAPPDMTRLPGVSGQRPLPHDGGLEVDLDDGADPQAVMRSILSAVEVRGVELRRLTLDEVFVRLVREDKGQEAAARAIEELTHV
ncbi:MAG: ABC transporter ATP-binding protein [Planctomycetota bacterium]|jgi:ABC-2 type transport system ATP-binding protein